MLASCTTRAAQWDRQLSSPLIGWFQCQAKAAYQCRRLSSDVNESDELTSLGRKTARAPCHLEVSDVVSDMSRYLFEHSGLLPQDDLRALHRANRGSSSRRAWAAFLSRAADAGNGCPSAFAHDANEMSQGVLSTAETVLVNSQAISAGWVPSDAATARLAELVAFEARDDLYDAVMGRIGDSNVEPESNQRNFVVRGVPALRAAIAEQSNHSGPCAKLTKARARHLYALTRRGELGWRAAWNLFETLMSRGLASWDLASTIAPTLPSLAAQEELLSQLEEMLGTCTSPRFFNSMALRAIVSHDTNADALRYLERAQRHLPPGKSADKFTVQYLEWTSDPRAHQKDILKAFRQYATAGLESGEEAHFLNVWKAFRAIPERQMDAATISTALNGCITAVEQADFITAYPEIVNIHCYNAVLNRCAAECDETTAHRVIEMLKASHLAPTAATERALRRCLAPNQPATDMSGMADMRCKHLESLLRWGGEAKAALPALSRRLSDYESFQHEHLEVLLHGAAGSDDELHDAAIVAGKSLGLLPSTAGMLGPRQFFRGFHSITTVMLFASIPPALFLI